MLTSFMLYVIIKISCFASVAQSLCGIALRMIWRKKNEIVEKRVGGIDCWLALSGQCGTVWRGTAGECRCAIFLRRYLWRFVL